MIKWQDTDLGTTGLDTDTGRGAVIGTGGKMALPILPLFVGASFALQSVYNVGKVNDTRRFWNTYYNNTGFRPRYPFRAGVYDYLKNDAWMMGAFGRTSGIYRKNFRRYR